MKSNLAICALLALLTLGVFWSVARCDFVNYDDQVFVTENPHVLGGLTPEGVKWAFTTSEPDYWRPLSWLSHQLDVELFGLKPAGHHITNLVFHIGATLLLFLALRMMTSAVWPSAFVAALFAVHPLHVESVAWVAERKDVLSGFFWMLTLLAYAHYAKSPSMKRYLLVFGAFVLSLMSKPMAVTLPCVLLLLDFWPLKRFTLEGRVPRVPDSTDGDSRSSSLQRRLLLRLVAEKLPMFALAIALSALALYGQKKVGAIVSTEAITWTNRLGNALVAYFEYLKKTIWPVDLVVFYPHPGKWPPAHVAIAAVFLLAISLWVFRGWRRQPFLATGWLWFFGTLVPVIGLIQVGSQAMADRYTYIPLIGVFIMLAWTVKDLLVQRPALARPATIGGIALVLACGIAAGLQVRHWRDVSTLFQHALSVSPDNALARLQFGETLNRLRRFEEAEQQLARAVAISPGWKLARFNYAMTLLNRGKHGEAIEQLNEALRRAPDFVPARFELATALAEMGRPAEAAAQYREALRFNPDLIEALNNLAWMLATHPDDRVRNGAEAVSMAERACALTQWQAPALMGTLAAAYAEAGRFSDAVTTAEKANALAESKGNAELASKNASLLELYRANKAYREAPAAKQQP